MRAAMMMQARICSTILTTTFHTCGTDGLIAIMGSSKSNGGQRVIGALDRVSLVDSSRLFFWSAQTIFARSSRGSRVSEPGNLYSYVPRLRWRGGMRACRLRVGESMPHASVVSLGGFGRGRIGCKPSLRGELSRAIGCRSWTAKADLGHVARLRRRLSVLLRRSPRRRLM